MALISHLAGPGRRCSLSAAAAAAAWRVGARRPKPEGEGALLLEELPVARVDPPVFAAAVLSAAQIRNPASRCACASPYIYLNGNSKQAIQLAILI